MLLRSAAARKSAAFKTEAVPGTTTMASVSDGPSSRAAEAETKLSRPIMATSTVWPSERPTMIETTPV